MSIKPLAATETNVFPELVESANNTATNITISSLSDGVHYWNVTCIDNATNSNVSETRNFTYTTIFTYLTNGTLTSVYGFANTVLNRTFYNATPKALQINLSYNNGTFLSQVFDAGGFAQLNNISF